MEKIAANLWNRLLEMFFPAFCLGCKSEGSFLCDICAETMMVQEAQICPFCHKKKHGGMVCGSCEKPDIFVDGLISAISFREQPLLQSCLYAFKYNFIEELARPLGKLLFRAWTSGDFGIDHPQVLFCAVPLHEKRLRFRGFNQAELLMHSFEQFYLETTQKKLLCVPLLQRIRFQRPQKELLREERMKNVVEIFSIKKATAGRIKEATIVLVDDVATTLSTLNSCAKVLKAAGARKVFGLVLAHGLGLDTGNNTQSK